MELLASQVQRVCTAAPAARIAAALPFLNASLVTADVTAPVRAAMYLANLAVESQEFQRTVENLNYSAERISQVWPRRYPTPADAASLAHNPQALANAVYADRGGNGDARSGDGWKYRGRGWIQVTLLDNYRACGLFLGVDLVAHPEWLEGLEGAARSAAWFWRTHGLNAFADACDVPGATHRINNGSTGLAERTNYYRRARSALGC